MKKFFGLFILLLVVLSLSACSSNSGVTTKYTLTIDIQGKGTVEPPTGSKYNKGTIVTLTTNPAPDWEFDLWDGPDAGEIADNKIVMTKDMEITAVFTERVAKPMISPAEGTYATAQEISITCSTTGVDIYYTVDGSVPDKNNGTRYLAPFVITNDTTIKAIAYKNGYLYSEVASREIDIINVAYIKADTTIIDENYSAFFRSNEISNSFIGITDVPATDFTPYDLIIISPGVLINTSQLANEIDNTLLPILGHGHGGRNFFNRLGLFIGDSTYFDDRTGLYQLVPENTDESIWDVPNQIDTSGTSITCYQQSSVASTNNAALDFSGGLLPLDVLLFGKIGTLSGSRLLVFEEDRYLFWGFGGLPLAMTDTGKELFINCMVYLVTEG